MAIYSVHLPGSAPDAASLADHARFLREGYCWPAFLFGPLWLLARGLWRPLIVWCLGVILVGAAVGFGRLPGAGAAWLSLASAILLGLEGRGLVAAAIERSGLRLVDVVEGADQTAAELAFFGRRISQAPAAARSPAPPGPPAAPSQVIGLFPEAGG